MTKPTKSTNLDAEFHEELLEQLGRIAGAVEQLVLEMQLARAEPKTAKPPALPLPDLSRVLCPLCGSRMTWKRNRADGAPFAGCSEFPTCRGTRPEWEVRAQAERLTSQPTQPQSPRPQPSRQLKASPHEEEYEPPF